MVKDELRRSVYSVGFTSTKVEPFYEKIPYFLLADRLETKRYAR